jgi:hypothetical protein
MNLYSYVVAHDTGFAPNPFWGFCTLACCKPDIRRVVGKNFQSGDDYWIVGLTPKAKDNKIIYVMRVTDVVSFDEYFNNKKYETKKPDFTKKELIYQLGDNIYQPFGNGEYTQLRSVHSKNCKNENWKEDPCEKCKDLKGKYVLISDCFYYLGREAEDLPADLKELKVGRGCRCNFEDATKLAFLEYVEDKLSSKNGITAPPSNWDKNDMSWQRSL